MEIGLWHSHPFTKSHFQFLIARGIGDVFSSLKKNDSSSARGQDSRSDGLSQRKDSYSCCVGSAVCSCIGVLNDHTSRLSLGVFLPYVSAVGWHTC